MDESQLVRATAAAAALAAGRGVTAAADGPTLRCTYRGGTQVVVRNSLRHLPSFSGERLLDEVSVAIVRAVVGQG